MTSIATTPPVPAAGSTSAAAPSSLGLGKDEFLKLLVSQLQHQDPMNPGDSKDFMGQMAQFTSVEQLSNMAKAIDRMSLASQTAQSVSLIGKTVTWTKADETPGEGVAQSVTFIDGVIKIKVGEDEIAPGEIESVR